MSRTVGERTQIRTDRAPTGTGAYSQAVRAGDLVFISGQGPLDPQTLDVVGRTVAEQTRATLRNLEAIAVAAGGSLDDVVKVSAFLASIDAFPEFNDAYAEYFSAQPPARATVAVAGLPKGARVEIECIARV